MSNTCRACGRVFSSMKGFEKHRTGPYTDTPPDYGRRCRNEEEMQGFGYLEQGGIWSKPPNEKQRARLRALHA